MKIIHCADIHLGSQMDAHLPKDKVKIRRAEVRNTFSELVEYAKREGIFHILLAGDVFDGERPLKTDREFFHNTVKSSPEIKFYYLRGNHDIKTGTEAPPENLLFFSDRWQSYDAGEAKISGIELTRTNCTSLYSGVPSGDGKFNIVMLHGQISGTQGTDTLSLPALTDKGIDYLALGHLHSYSQGVLGRRGVYAYSGCLEGRGFDECGKKGFVLLDIKDGKLTHEFIPFSRREIKSLTVDVGDTDGTYSLFLKIMSMGIGTDDLVRIELVGECCFELGEPECDTLAIKLAPVCFFARIKNRARRRINLDAIAGELSLRGEFVRTVMKKELPEDERLEVIKLGLDALSGADL